MALGKGGQSGSQSGSQSGEYTGTGTSSSTTDVTNTGDYSALLKTITGMGGAPDEQSRASQYYGDALTGGSGLGGVQDYFTNRMGNTGTYQLPGSLSGGQATQTTAAQAGGPGSVQAQTGASFMAPYEQGYTNDVVNATTGDLLNQYGRAQNRSNMAQTAAGGFMNSRAGLRDAQTTDDFLRTLATTSSGLRDQGFGRAVAAGQADAGLNLQGQQANQSANLQTDIYNAGNRQNTGQFNASNALNAGQFDASLGNNRQQFDVNSLFQGQAGRDAAAGANAGVIGQGSAINSGNAASLATLGGSRFQNLLATLAAGTPLFGTSTTGTTSGSGTTSGNTSGNSSSKGGGVSLGG